MRAGWMSICIRTVCTVKDNGYKVLVYRLRRHDNGTNGRKLDVLFNISHLSAPKDTRVQISAMVEKEDIN
jgi:hypothetical protein